MKPLDGVVDINGLVLFGINFWLDSEFFVVGFGIGFLVLDEDFIGRGGVLVWGGFGGDVLLIDLAKGVWVGIL